MLFTCPDQNNQRKVRDARVMQFDFLPKGRLFLQALKWCYTGFLKSPFSHKMKKPVLPSSRCCLKSYCSCLYMSGKHKLLHWIAITLGSQPVSGVIHLLHLLQLRALGIRNKSLEKPYAWALPYLPICYINTCLDFSAPELSTKGKKGTQRYF